MESWPLFWQILASILSAILAGGGVAALVSGFFNRPKTRAEAIRAAAEAHKTKAETTDILSDTAWETVKRLDERLIALEERDEKRQVEYEALKGEHNELQEGHRELRAEHEELRRKYDRLLNKSQNQERRIAQLERDLARSRERERALCAMLQRHGIDPDEEGT